MYKLAATALILIGGFLTALPLQLPAEKPANDEEGGRKTIVKFEQYGGFAGFHDDLTIFSDFSFELGTPLHVKYHFRGRLSEDQQKKLTGHLTQFGEFLVDQDQGPKVADGMRFRFEVHGTAADAAAKGDVRGLNLLMREIMEEARSGEKIPK